MNSSKPVDRKILSLILASIFLLTALSAVNYVSFASTAPPFSAAINLSNDSGTAKYPNVQNSGSNVYVSWTESSGGIYFRSSPNGGSTWNPPVTQTALKLSNKGGDASYPLMAAAGSDIYVVWSQTPGSGDLAQIYIAASTNDGATFSPAAVVYSDPSVAEITPVVSASGSTVYVAWTAGSHVFVASSVNSGATFGKPFEEAGPREPQLASSGSYGYAIADGNSLYVSSNNGATWTKESVKGCCGAEPWILASGSDVVAAWETKGTASKVYVISSQNDGKTWSSEFLLSSSVPDSWAPMVGISGDVAVIAWRSNPGGTLSQEYASSSTNGGATWSAATAIGISGHDNEWPFTVAISGDNIFVMWSEKLNTISSNSDWQTLVTYSSDNGATWSFPPTSLSTTPASGAQPEQDIATGAISNSGSSAFAVWENNATTSQIYFSSS